MTTNPITAPLLLSAPRRGLAQSAALAMIAALLCFSLLLPVINISSDLPWLKVEQALLPVVAILYLWLLFTGAARLIRWNGMMAIGVAFSFAIAVSIWYGAEILRHPILIRDYYEIPKAWLPVVFFTIGLESDLDENALCWLWRAFAATIALICLYAWAQFLRLPFTYALNSLYSAGEHIDTGLLVHGRVYSTMGNANVLGQLMTWAIAGFTMAFLFRIGNRVFNLALASACVVTLGMTGSRYGLITTAGALLLVVALPAAPNRRRTVQVALLALILPVFVWAFAATVRANQGNTQRIASLQHPLESDSLRARLDSLWLDAADDFLRSPVLGFGPAKAFYTNVFTDSEYLDVLKEFGVVGMLAYLAYYLYPLARIWKGMRNYRGALAGTRARVSLSTQPFHQLTARFAFVVGVTSLLMNVGESTFYNQLLQASVWLWLGLGAATVVASPHVIFFGRPVNVVVCMTESE